MLVKTATIYCSFTRIACYRVHLDWVAARKPTLWYSEARTASYKCNVPIQLILGFGLDCVCDEGSLILRLVVLTWRRPRRIAPSLRIGWRPSSLTRLHVVASTWRPTLPGYLERRALVRFA